MCLLGHLIDFKIFDELSVVGKFAQGKLRVHNCPDDLTHLEQRPSMALKPQGLVLPHHSIEHHIPHTAKRELESQRQPLQRS
jgi:hypothetical protein